MSRSDQVTRHWLLLQRLEGPRGATLQELAACLPEDMTRHPRTVRRDLEALEAHFPLIVERSGPATRWRLMDGYRHVPKLAFSATELMALVFSCQRRCKREPVFPVRKETAPSARRW